MLPGFLTTALEIIIILDICGAIVYFTLTGLSKKKKAQPAISPLPSEPTPVLAFDGPALAIPPRISPSVYTPETPGVEEQKQSWSTGLKARLVSIKERFTYKPAPNSKKIETKSLDADYNRLGRVLDSFKEET